MVVASDEIPGPARKRPRLSLKSTYRKHGDVQLVPSGEHQGATPHDIHKETTPDPNTRSPVGLSNEDEELADDSVSFAPNEGPTVPPVSSLENIGNTCFLNSVLQVLRYTPKFLDGLGKLFREIIAVEKNKTKSTNTGGKKVNKEDGPDSFLTWEFVKQLFTLYKNMEKREERYFEFASADITSMAVKPSQLLDTIRSLNPMFEGNLQHDAQELLRCILGYLEDAEKQLHRTQLDLMGGKQSPHPSITRGDEARSPAMHCFLDTAKTGRTGESLHEAPSGDCSSTERFEELDEVDGGPCGDGDNIQNGSHLLSAADCLPITCGQALRARIVKSKYLSKTRRKMEKTGSVSVRKQSQKHGNSSLTKSASESDLLNSRKPQRSIARIFKRDKPPGKRLGIRRRIIQTKECVSEIRRNKSDISNYLCTVDSEVSFRFNSEASSKLDAESSEDSSSVTAVKSEQFPVTQVETVKLSNSSIHSISLVKTDYDSTNCKKTELAKSSPVKEASSGVCRAKLLKPFDGGSPREIKISLQKCDHVCSSPLKTVIATEAMKTLGCAVRKVNFDSDPQILKAKAADDKKCVDLQKSDDKNCVDLQKSDDKNCVSLQKSDDKDCFNLQKSDDKDCFNLQKSDDKNCIDLRKSDDKNCINLRKSDEKNCVDLRKCDDDSLFEIYSDDSSDDMAECYLKTVPVKPLSVKVVNCDKICDSPLKSVSAAFAMKYLSGTNVHRMDFVEQLFEGSMVLRTRCLECESCREKTEAFQDVSVPIRSQRDDDDDSSSDTENDNSCLSKLMSAFTEVERLRDDNKYYCDQCLCYVEAERSLHYDTLPNILTLHLKRFSTSAGMFGSHSVTKINDHVTIPLALPCLRYKCPKPCGRPEHRYTLFGIVTHAGMTISSGHYLSYVKVMVNRSQNSSNSNASSQPWTTSAHCSSDFQGVHVCTGSGDNPLSQHYTPPVRADSVPSGTDNSSLGKDNSLIKKEKCVSGQHSSPVKKDNCVVGKDNSYVGKDNSSCKANCVSEKESSLTKNCHNSAAGKDNSCGDSSMCDVEVEWLECDDECIRVHSDEEFQNCLTGKDGSLLGSPYVLFYRKIIMSD